MRHSILKTLITIALAAIASFAGQAQQTNFHITRTIALGGDGSWDYLHFDPDANRLFIARSTRVLVVDLEAGKLVGEISDTAGVHGVALAQAQGRGATSNGKANTASIFDLHTLKVLANVQTGEKPDGILWEPFTKTVLTMNAVSNSITVIDVSAEKVVAAIPLPGRPESAVSDGKGRVFVNLEDKAQIAEVDMRSRSVGQTWELANCTGPTGLAIDRMDGRLFSGCHNGVLVVVDAESGRNIQKLPIGLGVDAVTYDENLRLVFTSNKEGSISVIAQASADNYSNRETVKTLPGAKTMALDPVRHIIYTVGDRDGQFVLLEAGR